jgi:hypothetical protein
MPALPDYPNVLKVRTLFEVGTDATVATTWHFAYTGTAPSNATCTTIAADILAGAVTHLLPAMSGSVNLLGVQVQDLTSATAGFGESLGTHSGTRSGSPLPGSTCVLINQPIDRRYRGGKPRTYWPFGSGADLTDPQAWASAAISDFIDAIQLYLDVILALVVSGTTISDWVSISYYSGFTAVLNPITGRTRDVPKVRSAAIAPDVINTFTVNPKPGSQRRRIAA